jgi:GNAT superfamily N-acetyltransferase
MANVNNIAIGYIFIKIIRRERNPFSNAREFVYIDQICVTKQFRNKGVAKSLVNKAIKVAKELGIKRIELDYWTRNKPAGNAFRTMGFSTYNEKMFINVV